MTLSQKGKCGNPGLFVCLVGFCRNHRSTPKIKIRSLNVPTRNTRILYELQAPDTHAFRIAHNYTVRKVGEKYLFST